MAAGGVQNRAGWMMGTLAALGILAAVAITFNAFRSSDATPKEILQGAKSPPSDDPLAPRIFESSATIRVHVAGAVRKPGVYSLPSWSRVIDALRKAGGATPMADLDAINLADRLKDAEQVRIPYKGRPAEANAHPPAPEPPPTPRDAGGHGVGRFPFVDAGPTAAGVAGQSSALAPGAPGGKVNLNSAGLAELDSLPGVGEKTAQAIVQFREQQGAFQKPEDLMNVKGIGAGKFERLRDLVEAP